ncbi:MAG: Arc family DNA-binding protein [Lachnospiraceae bacterium]|nr:Arc family DNA-binding protein [Lachnospiraceae bacterium]
MKKEKDKHLGLRIDSETHEKLKDLAEYDGRSINGEVLYLIRKAIMQHEQQNGNLSNS